MGKVILALICLKFVGSANLDLRVNSKAVARMYHGDNAGYYRGASLQHIQVDHFSFLWPTYL